MQVRQGGFRSTVVRLSAGLAIWGVTGVPPAAAQDSTAGYSVKDFLGVAVFREVEVAPNGRHVAFIVAADDFAQDREDVAIWRLDLDESGRKTALTRLTWKPAEYSEVRWSSDARSLSFLVSREDGGDDASAQLHVLSVLGGESHQVTDSVQFASGIMAYDWAPDGRSIMLAAAAPLDSAQRNARAQFYGDALRLNGEIPRGALFRLDSAEFGSRKATLVTVVPFPVAEIRHSPDGHRVAFRSTEAPTGYSDSFSEVEVYVMPITGSEAPRQLTRNFAIEDGITWLRDGSGLYMGGFGDESAQRNVMTNSRLYAVKLDGSTSKNALPGFEGSVEEYALLSDGSLLATAIVSTNLNVYRVTAVAGAGIPNRFDKVTSYRGRVLNLSASRDAKVIAYVVTDHRSFPELYVASGWNALGGGKAVRMTQFNASVDALAKPEVETIRWSNGEGDTIEGVLYWPPGKRGARNLPFVQRMHGGPWLASTEALIPSTSRFMYYGALLATRGYLVLETNYRGSVGRGDDFLHAIEGYGCSRPATDILTGVDYVIARGWADSTRMGVGGWSYGGILTNCLIGRTTRFRAAASGAGDWNATSAFGTGDTFYWYHVMNGGKPPWEHLEQYWAESGISTASRVRTPTIFTHGDADGVVPTSQGYEAYRSLVWLGVPTELLVFPGEGHVFRKPSHKVTKVEAELAWFEKYLLGKR